MNYQQRVKIIEQANQRRAKIMEVAAHDYARSDADVNANFGRLGVLLTEVLAGPRDVKYKTWAVYFLKHLDSLLGWLAGREQKREGIVGRMDDIRNYVDILESMMEDDKLAETPAEVLAPSSAVILSLDTPATRKPTEREERRDLRERVADAIRRGELDFMFDDDMPGERKW